MIRGSRQAVLFWETGRVAYNALLAATVLATAGWNRLLALPVSEAFGLIGLATIANLLYGLAYAAEFLMQGVATDRARMRARLALWAAGTALASGLAFAAVAPASVFLPQPS